MKCPVCGADTEIVWKGSKIYNVCTKCIWTDYDRNSEGTSQ